MRRLKLLSVVVKVPVAVRDASVALAVAVAEDVVAVVASVEAHEQYVLQRLFAWISR